MHQLQHRLAEQTSRARVRGPRLWVEQDGADRGAEVAVAARVRHAIMVARGEGAHHRLQVRRRRVRGDEALNQLLADEHGSVWVAKQMVQQAVDLRPHRPLQRPADLPQRPRGNEDRRVAEGGRPHAHDALLVLVETPADLEDGIHVWGGRPPDLDVAAAGLGAGGARRGREHGDLEEGEHVVSGRRRGEHGGGLHRGAVLARGGAVGADPAHAEAVLLVVVRVSADGPVGVHLHRDRTGLRGPHSAPLRLAHLVHLRRAQAQTLGRAEGLRTAEVGGLPAGHALHVLAHRAVVAGVADARLPAGELAVLVGLPAGAATPALARGHDRDAPADPRLAVVRAAPAVACHPARWVVSAPRVAA
mmetsp:Transcript_25135/g.65676  ORF Transcript_25135/g.65676 Transcript_25135/m.65676 type:complete len:361 (-) Transcript_25135:589-1671(-)